MAKSHGMWGTLDTREDLPGRFIVVNYHNVWSFVSGFSAFSRVIHVVEGVF